MPYLHVSQNLNYLKIKRDRVIIYDPLFRRNIQLGSVFIKHFVNHNIVC